MLKKMSTLLFGMAILSTYFFGVPGQDVDVKPVKLPVEEFETKAGDLVDQMVEIEGTVIHVCRYGGKRLFLIGEKSKPQIKVTTSNKISAFDAKLEGSDIIAEGILREFRVDEAYLDQLEKNARESAEKALNEDRQGHDLHRHQDPLKSINNMREQLKKSGKDYLSFFSVECSAYKVKED
jgi:hypothetical protein